VSKHFGLLWVAVEATTLASAPLIFFHRQRSALEATWKYLLVCSVGIALALLGNFFLAVAASAPGRAPIPLVVEALVAAGKSLDPMWLQAAFIFLLVGYGTKMGLAPMHTWLPDAHSEAPAVVSALLSGCLLNSAFLALLRAFQVLNAAGMRDFAQSLLLAFGLISLLFAAVFIIGQTDYKRLLAYSSVEHMGILAFGIGIGGLGTWGSLLHTLNHSLTKAMLFLVAGNIYLATHTKQMRGVGGLGHQMPMTGTLWLLGLFAITGAPPFGPFISEFTILRAAFHTGHYYAATAMLFLLAVIFIAMSGGMINMVQGQPRRGLGPGAVVGGADGLPAPVSESTLTILPPLLLALLVLILGLYLPPTLSQLLAQGAGLLTGSVRP